MDIGEYLSAYFDVDFFALRQDQAEFKFKHNYPKSWAEFYHQNNYYIHDPVLNNKQNNYFFWKDLSQNPTDKHQNLVMQQANDFGIQSGITFKLKNNDQVVSYFTLASTLDEHKFQQKILKQINNVLALTFILQKHLETTLHFENLTLAIQQYHQATHLERQYHFEKYSTALTRLNLLETKMLSLYLPSELKHFMQSQYDQLRQLFLVFINRSK